MQEQIKEEGVGNYTFVLFSKWRKVFTFAYVIWCRSAGTKRTYLSPSITLLRRWQWRRFELKSMVSELGHEEYGGFAWVRAVYRALSQKNSKFELWLSGSWCLMEARLGYDFGKQLIWAGGNILARGLLHPIPVLRSRNRPPCVANLCLIFRFCFLRISPAPGPAFEPRCVHYLYFIFLVFVLFLVLYSVLFSSFISLFVSYFF